MTVRMHDYRKLRVYGQALRIAERTYGLTATLPTFERFGLVDQMNRASVSIAANIAEGAGRGGRKEFARFLRIARGSACELEALCNVCVRLKVADAAALAELRSEVEHVKAGLTNLDRSLAE